MIIYSSPSFKRKGFTLIELTVVLMISLMIGAASLALFTQQIASMKMLKRQNFLLRDAPETMGLLNKIIPRANAFQMFTDLTTVDNGASGIAPVYVDADGDGLADVFATVLVLRYQDSTIAAGNAAAAAAGLTSTYSAIVFDPATNDLDYYNNLANPAALVAGGVAAGPPSWKIATNVSNAYFFVQTGVIRITIVGPRGEQITFSSTTLH